MDATNLHRAAQALPIFPLPDAVLLPGMLLPLHVFEPRYRALIASVRGGDGVLGIATLRPGYEAEYEGSPPIYPEIGVGSLVAHQPLPDGRCNVVIQHLAGARLQTELHSIDPFRRVRAEIVEPSMDGLQAAASRLQVMVLQLGGISPEAAAEGRRLVQLGPMELVDSLARRVLQTQEERRAYLIADRVVDRIERVCDKLADFLAAVEPVGRA